MKDLLGKYVKFRCGRKNHVGRVVSIEQKVANIRGFEQKKTERPAYHYHVDTLRELTHDEVFKLGRTIKALIS